MAYNRGHADHSREPADRSADRVERGEMDMGAKICPYCGAYLDPDEKCDCRDEDIATSQNEKDPDADQSKSESQ
ncbi:MAG: hypothetical protein HDR24_00255 [Lachnospiraceae bacterium]|nr:hypothetical protein [Lachnospiraceae bacterium]